MAVTTSTRSVDSSLASARPAVASGQALLRIGGWSGIAGAALVLVANGLHPHPADFRLEALLQQIAQTGYWAPLHLVLILGILGVLGALVAITLSTRGEPAATVSRFACVAALLGGALLFTSTSMDGFAMNQLARAWLSAPATEQASALRVADALENAQYAVYSLSIVTFLGIGILLYGLALLLDRAYPKPLGWLAVVAGAGAVVVGAAQTMNGPQVRWTEIFFVLFSMLSTAWILIMGLLMLRNARNRAPGDHLAHPG